MAIRHISVGVLSVLLGARSASALAVRAEVTGPGRIVVSASLCGEKDPGTLTFYHLWSATTDPLLREPLVLATVPVIRGTASITIDGVSCGEHHFAAAPPGVEPRLDLDYPLGFCNEGVDSVTLFAPSRVDRATVQTVLPGGWISVRLRGGALCISSFSYGPHTNVDATRVRLLLSPEERPPVMMIAGVPLVVPPFERDGLEVAYEDNAIVVAGLEPGGWAVTWNGYSESIARDLDGDGAVRLPASEHVLILNPAGGRFRAFGRPNRIAVRPFPAGVLQGPRDGLPTRLSLRSNETVLWMRPGVGLWRSIPAGVVADPVRRVPAHYAAARFVPLAPDTPPAPAVFEPDDLLFIGPDVYGTVTLGQVRDLLADFDTDDAPVLAVDDVPFTPGAAHATFVVRLSSPATLPVRVRYTTLAVTARASRDYVPAAGELVFAPGDVEKRVDVALVPTRPGGADRVFTLRLHDAAGALIRWNRGMAWIDPPARRRSAAR